MKSRVFDMDFESASFIGGDPSDQAMRDSVFSSFEWLVESLLDPVEFLTSSGWIVIIVINTS